MRQEHGGCAAAGLEWAPIDPISCVMHNSARQLKKGDLNMSGNRKGSALGRVLDVFGSAVLVATAVESGHRPFDRDLVRLGIDPRAFRKIHRF
jgi:hypothetical protein